MAIDVNQGPDLATVVVLLKDRANTLKEMAEQAQFLFVELEEYEEKAAAKQFKAAAAAPLRALRGKLEDVSDWRAESLQACIQAVVDELSIGFGKVGQPLRVAITGRGAAPANDQVLELLGPKVAIERIDRALAYIAASEQS
jgi:glutamyl-tRNA synthetase